MTDGTDISIAGHDGYTRQGLAVALCQSPQTIAGWAARNKGPKYMKIGRIAVYLKEDVEEWLIRQKKNHKE
jgi:hypothetical protein